MTYSKLLTVTKYGISIKVSIGLSLAKPINSLSSKLPILSTSFYYFYIEDDVLSSYLDYLNRTREYTIYAETNFKFYLVPHSLVQRYILLLMENSSFLYDIVCRYMQGIKYTSLVIIKDCNIKDRLISE